MGKLQTREFVSCPRSHSKWGAGLHQRLTFLRWKVVGIIIHSSTAYLKVCWCADQLLGIFKSSLYFEIVKKGILKELREKFKRKVIDEKLDSRENQNV